ncbi:MAG TPA: hypothetical protein VMX79_01075 [bacterium]|nr:hypothetical protein [bacterium]
MKLLKRLTVPLLIVVVVIVAALAVRWLFARGEGAARAPARQAEQPPPGWRVVDDERTSGALQKLNPLHRPTQADVIMRDWPAGSRVVHVETEGGEHVELGILPGGEVAVPEGQPHDVTVYYKPEPAVALELRPFVGAGLGTSGPAVMGGVDVIRAWRFHLGPGVAVAFPDKEIAAVGTLGYSVWRNVDVRLAGGYGTAGGVAAVGVSLAIE